MEKRSFSIRGHRVHLRLEKEYWDALTDISARERWTIGDMITYMYEDGMTPSALATRCYAFTVTYYRQASPCVVFLSAIYN